MKNLYENLQTLTAAYVDGRCELGVYHASLLLQDAFTGFFTQLGCPGIVMARTHGAVWAIVRSKFLYERMPVWDQTVRLRAFPVKISGVTVHLNMVVESLEGETLLRCRQELCAVDVTDHSLRRLNTTAFPTDLPVETPILDKPFRRRKGLLEEDCYVYTHTARTTDTDSNGHVNNTVYVHLLADAFPSSFWNAHTVREFDIHHAAESMEGDQLAVYRKLEGEEAALQIRCGDRLLVNATMVLKARE